MTLNEVYGYFEDAKQAALRRLQEEVVTLRTGRVTTAIVESVQVEHYGARTPLNGVAAISSADARTLVIAPWDPGALEAIKKALADADLGVAPTDDGKVVRLIFPSLTEENRKRSVKVLGGYAEETRVRLRQARDEALRIIKQGKEKSDFTEDDFYAGKEKLDELIDAGNKEIATLVEKKEAEIAAV